MLSPKRLVENARNGILFRKEDDHASTKANTALVADKSHFIAYSEDGVGFMVPLAFLKSPTFQELINFPEDEFGLPGDGPITLRCNTAFMEYTRRMDKDVELALLASLAAKQCSSSILSDPRFNSQHL